MTYTYSHIENFTKAYKYKFNQREYQDELGLNTTAMDYRQYDQALGRFNTMDRLSELAPHMTSYRFAFNNPVYWSDPSGLYEVDKNGNIKITDADEIKNFMSYLNNNKGASVQKMSDEIFYSGNYAYELQEVVVTARSSSSYNKATQNIFNQIQGAQSKMANFNGYVTHTGGGALDNFSRFNDGFGGAMEGLGYSSASYRLTNGSLNGSSISPKVYSSGWKGGSRAGITTYGISNTAKWLGRGSVVTSFGVGAYDVSQAYKLDGNTVGYNTTVQAFKSSGSIAGGYYGAVGGAKVGAAIGVWFGGVGAVPGAIIGGIIGGVGGSYFGGELGGMVGEEVAK